MFFSFIQSSVNIYAFYAENSIAYNTTTMLHTLTVQNSVVNKFILTMLRLKLIECHENTHTHIQSSVYRTLARKWVREKTEGQIVNKSMVLSWWVYLLDIWNQHWTPFIIAYFYCAMHIFSETIRQAQVTYQISTERETNRWQCKYKEQKVLHWPNPPHFYSMHSYCHLVDMLNEQNVGRI